jgi:hypothetical protein
MILAAIDWARTPVLPMMRNVCCRVWGRCPMIERYRVHPVAAGETGDADLFAFEIVGRLDLFAHRESTDELVDEPGNEDTIQTV